jgi:hypothetical protein
MMLPKLDHSRRQKSGAEWLSSALGRKGCDGVRGSAFFVGLIELHFALGAAEIDGFAVFVFALDVFIAGLAADRAGIDGESGGCKGQSSEGEECFHGQGDVWDEFEWHDAWGKAWLERGEVWKSSTGFSFHACHSANG